MTLPALLAAAAGHAEQSRILLALAFVLVGARLFGALVERLGQPGVLGELLLGVALGNLALLGGPDLSALSASETFAILAELGAILLLLSRITVGIGMMPRGEVGLIFAGIGAGLALGGRPVVGPRTYAAAVFMVVATTMATPPLLLWSLRRDGRAPTEALPR